MTPCPPSTDAILALLAAASQPEVGVHGAAQAIATAVAGWSLITLRDGDDLAATADGVSPSTRPQSGPWLDVDAPALVTPPDTVASVAVAPLVTLGERVGTIAIGPRAAATADDLALVTRLAPALAQACWILRARRRESTTRSEFLSTVAHELRSPLTSVQLILQATAQHLERPDAEVSVERLRALAARGVRQGLRAVKLLDLLLDVARVDRARLELRVEPADLATVVRDVTTSYAEDLRHAGCELKLEVAAPAPGIWDVARLEQVVTNLLSNAMKFAPGRPVEVTVGGDAVTARLVVRDHGAGISEARLSRLFDKFQRDPGQKVPGVGLGLFISRRIVEAHGGTLRARSELGAGATFVVELPAVGSADVRT